jgi:hypothetical protein
MFIDVRQAYDSILREKLYEALLALKIPEKLVRLIKATMKDTTAQVRIQTELTDALQMKNRLKQRDRLAAVLFNLSLEYVIWKVPIATNSTVFYKSAQLVGDAGDINILGRSRAVAEEVHSAVEIQAKETGLSINVDKTKIIIQTRKTIAGQVIHINNQDIEIVDSFVYLGSSLNTRNDETTEIRRRILMANIAYFSVLYLIKSRTIHQKNKISI